MNKKLIGLFFVLVLGLITAWYLSTIIMYMVVSVILATILRPLVNAICFIEIMGISIPRGIAILYSYVVLLFIITLFFLLLLPPITEQINILSTLNYEEIFIGILELVKSFELFLINNGLTKSPVGFIENDMNEWLKSFVIELDFSSFFSEIIAFTGNFFVGFLAILFITSILLYEQGILRKNFIALIPNAYFEIFINGLYKIEKLLSNYLLGLALQLSIIFTIASLGLYFMGIKYAVTIALFAAVANIIPYLGPVMGSLFGIIVGTIPIAILGSTHDIIWIVIKIISVFLFIQVTDNFVIQPLVYSKSVKAHPLEIFIVIFVGAALSGIVGMIVAIPAYTILRVSFTEIFTASKRYRVFKLI